MKAKSSLYRVDVVSLVRQEHMVTYNVVAQDDPRARYKAIWRLVKDKLITSETESGEIQLSVTFVTNIADAPLS